MCRTSWYFAFHTVGLNDILTLCYVNFIRHNFTVRVMPKRDSFCPWFPLAGRALSGDSLTLSGAVGEMSDAPGSRLPYLSHAVHTRAIRVVNA